MENNLGRIGTDTVSGFTGRVVARCEYVSGSPRYELLPKVDDKGALPKSEWFDQERLTFAD